MWCPCNLCLTKQALPWKKLRCQHQVKHKSSKICCLKESLHNWANTQRIKQSSSWEGSVFITILTPLPLPVQINILIQGDCTEKKKHFDSISSQPVVQIKGNSCVTGATMSSASITWGQGWGNCTLNGRIAKFSQLMGLHVIYLESNIDHPERHILKSKIVLLYFSLFLALLLRGAI